eukprot:scaffold57012_cov63-Cyclotella_meneghiniana.AAC.2
MSDEEMLFFLFHSSIRSVSVYVCGLAVSWLVAGGWWSLELWLWWLEVALLGLFEGKGSSG